ncbi:MAG: hypothetical protein ACOX87_04305 [Chloroflexota bacterium]|jgi:hypothetical protein
MGNPPEAAPREPGSPLNHTPTGGVPLSEERLKLLAPAWETTYRSLRQMDELELGETEPATLFVWGVDP